MDGAVCMFFTVFESLCKQNGKSATAVGNELGISKTTISYWRNTKGVIPKQDALVKIANYFNVSADYLLGNDATTSTSAKVNDDDIKFALFGNDGEITDEMYDEVKKFAEYVKAKYQKD